MLANLVLGRVKFLDNVLYYMKIVIDPNLLIRYDKLKEDKGKLEQKIDCYRSDFKKDKYTGGCQRKCFRCGLELTISE